MKIGKIAVIREGKRPPDKRTPLTPEQCKKLQDIYPDLEILVQKSKIRAYADEEYQKLGLKLVDDVSEADVLFGVKEVNIEDLIPNKTFFFFSHTTKMQPYNRNLLRAILDMKIKLVDYEELRSKKGKRLIGFGRYAGVVGCYNGLLAYGQRTGKFNLKPAHHCEGMDELENELSKITLPQDFKIVLTGTGRVAKGAMEILEKKGVKKLTPKQFLNEGNDKPVYVQLSVGKYNKRKDGKEFKTPDFYRNPKDFESDFYQYAKVADMYIAGHFWDSKAPQILTKEQISRHDFKLKVIADISCDIKEPIASTLRPSTIDEPVYGYDRISGKEVSNVDNDNVVSVMAVDNLPCELPKDASEGFGETLLEKIIPNLLEGNGDIIERATIAEGGKLKPGFQYLQGFVDGKI